MKVYSRRNRPKPQGTLCEPMDTERTRESENRDDNQMPPLLEWAALEGDYSTCISGTIKALQDASNRLPATEIVKTNTGELEEALDSATRLLGLLSINARKFIPQAAGLKGVTGDLARVVRIEKDLLQECRDLLFLAQDLQVQDCSLRTQLMQLKHKDERKAID